MKRTLEFIEAVVCLGENVEPKDLHNRSRFRRITETRQMIMYLGSKYENTLQACSDYFGLIQHSTSIHARNTVRDLIDTNKDFAQRVSEYEHEIIRDDSFNKIVYLKNRLLEIKTEATKIFQELEQIPA